MRKPPKNILIATVGASPAVVTETLWALMNPEKLRSGRNRERFVPDTVHVITTKHGQRLFRHFDLGRRIEELYRQHGETPPAVHVDVPEVDGEPINDIRTQMENIAYADHLSAMLRNYTAAPETKVHVSIAGGRKTMTSFGHTALMFLGRPQDELSHVLVEPPMRFLHGSPETMDDIAAVNGACDRPYPYKSHVSRDRAETARPHHNH